MVEGKIISITNVAYVLGMSFKKLNRWYKDHLSGYATCDIGEHDILVQELGEDIPIKVPIHIPENIGSHMAIDEKNIGGHCFTILTNRTTGKIASMVGSLKVEHLSKVYQKFENRVEVRSLTRDLAQNYDWLGRQMFINAYHVADKFHVIKNVLECLQNIRVEHRQLELAKRRQAHESHKKEEASRKWESKLNPTKPYKPRPFNYKEYIHSNGDTTLQLLARSRGLLFKLPHQWTNHQKVRAQILFETYPDINHAYLLVVQFRKWYEKSSLQDRLVKEEQLNLLIAKMEDLEIYQLSNAASLIKRHEGVILNYFVAHQTNALAETINGIIQRFIRVNFGTKDLDFFLFRLKAYLA